MKDPLNIDQKQTARITKYATEYFDKAVFKRKKMRYEKERAKVSGDDLRQGIAVDSEQGNNLLRHDPMHDGPPSCVLEDFQNVKQRVDSQTPCGSKRKASQDASGEQSDYVIEPLP